MAGGTKEYNKTILQTSFTSLEYIYYLLEVVRKNQPMTSADGKDTIFPAARARIAQERGGEWSEDKRDTHAELTLREMKFIRYIDSECTTFEVSDIGYTFLDAFTLVEEPTDGEKVKLSLHDNLSLDEKNQLLFDILVHINVKQERFGRNLRPYLILFKLLSEPKFEGGVVVSNLKIFTDNIEPTALNQIYTLIKQPAFAKCKVRIMPDVHAGTGCVIGFTADLGDKVIPNIVGVDIGCGMLTVELGKIDIDFDCLDSAIRENIPSGREVNEVAIYSAKTLKNLRCYKVLKDPERLVRSIGSLGGGNHFIEIDADSEGMKYLVIHTGSRNLGKQVAEYYQNLAIETMQGKDELMAMQEKLIADYKAQGRKSEIQKAISEIHRKFSPNPLRIPKELCYLTGKHREDYLYDMKECQRFATNNRCEIANRIVSNLFGGKISYWDLPMFETIHNYIEFGTNMVRKGAISAKAGEKLLIPINMRDGCIIGVGKGNEDWNCSAPHGAGRTMSRNRAKELISLKEYEDSMKGIFTTSVNSSTIDESPMAYKTIDEIIANIADTVEVVNVIKPVYNFKASE